MWKPGIGMPTTSKTQIFYFRSEHAFLSNFSSVPGGLAYEGLVYKDVESAYQAQKTLVQKERVAISQTSFPTVAKALGRRVKLRADWETVKQDIMLELLLLKFADTPATVDLRYLLANTDEKELVEGNDWHDQIWGRCNCDKHRDASLPTWKEYARETGDDELTEWRWDGTGENWLGRLLETVRATL